MRSRVNCGRWAGAAALAAALMVPATASATGFGSANPAFAGSGSVASSAELVGVATDSSGDVIAVGQAGGKLYVEKLNSSGAVQDTYTGAAGIARAVAVQSNGDVVIAGSSATAMLVQRLLPNLTPDTSFGSGGTATAFAGQSAVANAVAITSGGDIVAAGSTSPADTKAAVAEFTSSGAPASFGSGGTTSFITGPSDNDNNFSAINGIGVEPAGQIVYAGQETGTNGITEGTIGALNTDGSNDSSFSGSTYYQPLSGGGASAYTTFTSAVIAPGGQIVVGGVDYGGEHALLLRYNSDGSLDSGFGSGGVTTISAVGSVNGPDSRVGAYGVAVAGGDTVIGAGQYETTATDYSGALWGLSSSGSLASNFANNGVLYDPPGSTATPYEACAVAVAPDGTIYTVGYTPTQTPDQYPCAAGAGTSGFVASIIGNGPPPAVTGVAPVVVAGAAGSVSQTGATVSGTINPEGQATAYYFQYGTTTAYGAQTAPASAGAGSTATTATATLTNLMPGTTYHYQLVAANGSGSASGADGTFTTAAATGAGGPNPTAKPMATSGTSSHAGETSVKIAGQVTPDGLATTYYFQYGKTTSYGVKTTARSAGAGTSAVSVSSSLGGLTVGSTYHYRLVATNADGTSYGAARTLKTAARLSVVLKSTSAAVKSRELSVKLTCSAACSVKATLKLSKALAEKLRVGRVETTVATGSGKLSRRGTLTLRLTVVTQDAKALSQHDLATSLQLVATPGISGPKVTLTRTLKLNP